MKEVYVSCDIETNGPIPGPYSMLSLGAIAHDETAKELGRFTINIEPLEGASEHPDTMLWWMNNKEAYYAATINTKTPETAMRQFNHWLKALPGKPVCVAYPAGFDFMFIYWYQMNFAGESPFGFSCIDMKTYAMAKLKKPYKWIKKSSMPKSWFNRELKHTHQALDDAIEQSFTWFKMFWS